MILHCAVKLKEIDLFVVKFMVISLPEYSTSGIQASGLYPSCVPPARRAVSPGGLADTPLVFSAF